MKKHIIRPVAPTALFLLLTVVSGCGAFIKRVASSKRTESYNQKSETQTKVVANSSQVDDSATVDQLAMYSESLLKKGRYEELRAKIDEARITQERLPGGYWKLYALYEGLSTPNYKKNATPSEWEQHLARLTEWKAAMPDAVSPRIALAKALIDNGWEARGENFVDKVSDESMRIFLSRAKMAEKELLEAKELTPKCPRWYETMLRVGIAQSWSRTKYDAVLEEGFQLAPTYYHLPRQKMHYLLPQWMGQPGDIAKFVSNVSDRIGGDEGSILYYELSATMWPQYRSYIWGKTGLDPKRAKTGYDTLKRVYGVDRYRKNLRMAMAQSYGSSATEIEEVLLEVGDDWDAEVWGTRERFNENKDMLKRTVDIMKNASKSLPPGSTAPGFNTPSMPKP